MDLFFVVSNHFSSYLSMKHIYIKANIFKCHYHINNQDSFIIALALRFVISLRGCALCISEDFFKLKVD